MLRMEKIDRKKGRGRRGRSVGTRLVEKALAPALTDIQMQENTIEFTLASGPSNISARDLLNFFLGLGVELWNVQLRVTKLGPV